MSQYISILANTNAFSSGIDDTKSFKKFSPFTQRNNIPGVMEQTSAHFAETPLAKYSKYEFCDDNGGKFIIDNAEFEEEEKELMDIFYSNSEILPSNPFYDRGSYNENYHFIPIPDTSDNPTNEDAKQNDTLNNHHNANLQILPSNPFYEMLNNHNNDNLEILPSNPFYEMLNNHNNANFEILPSNPFYERGFYDEVYHFTPIPLNSPLGNYTDEDGKENNVSNNADLEIFPTNPFHERGSYNCDYFIPTALNSSTDEHTNEDVRENSVISSRKKNIFRRMKSFFQKLRKGNCNGFTYQRFK
ncbi:hypothetical protein TNCV_1471801 [Trichonephila clavipes]|nr:hypothetical protein TNCV_1471801 [Trichonephila clavipes]